MEYAWDFNNDGRDDSYARDPTFTYSYPGTYSVRHTVSNDAGSDGETKTGYITVTEGQPGGSNAGIALTFDDNSVDQWYAIRGLLQQYNAHATFFVSQPGNLDGSQLDKLRTLQADGHEIGYHGYAHLDAAAYLQTHSIQQYIDNEITPGVSLMQNAGLNPADFAYPYGSESGPLTAALAAYFGHVRGTHSAVYSPLYYEYGSGQLLIQGVGIDDLSYGNTINEIYDAISGAKQEDQIIIFYAHVPVETVSGDYQISYDRLEKILIYGSNNNMKFYTVSELT
jgi:PKD repeat protein